MWTRGFWLSTVERAVRTFAQTLIATLGLESAGILHANWTEGLSLAAGAAVLAVLTALATSGGTHEGPGLTERPRREQAALAAPAGTAGAAGRSAGEPEPAEPV